MNGKTLTINTDGGSRGNPGPAAWGFVVKEDGNVMHEDKGYMGISTNNQAEYTAVLHAMLWLEKLFVAGPVTRQPHGHPQGEPRPGGTPSRATREDRIFQEVIFILDSELVARQLSGIYKIKDAKLQNLAKEIKDLEKKLTCAITYTVVRREQNKEADLLVNTALDENESGSH